MTDTTSFGDPVLEKPKQTKFGDVIAGDKRIIPEGERASSLGSFLAGLTNEFLGAYQKTSPIITDDRKILGELAESDIGPVYRLPDGKEEPVDPDKHVVLKDPATNKILVLERSESSEENSLMALGRLLGFGAITSPVGVSGATHGVTGAGTTAAQRRVADAAASGVDTTMAAATQSRTAKMTQNTLQDIPIVGGIVSDANRKIAGQGAAAVERLASSVGEGMSAADAGAALRRGGEAFVRSSDEVTDAILRPARATSFQSKARAIYDKALDLLGNKPVDMRDTLEALEGAKRRFDNTGLAQEFVNPKLARWAEIIRDSEGVLSVNDLRQFRTEIGAMIGDPKLLKDIPTAQLDAVYAALSKDLMRAAEEIGPESANALRRADQFYKAAIKRIKNALKEITRDGGSDESLFQMVQRIAGEKGSSANLKKLTQIRRSMPDEEWDVVVSTFLRDMGKTTAGTKDLASVDFSIATFVTNYAKLSDKTKDIIFSGKGPLRQSYDRLANVLSAQKEVDRVIAPSGTRIGMIGSGAFVAFNDMMTNVLTGIGAASAAKLMTSPRFVAWWVNAQKAKNVPSHIAKLRLVLKGEPELQPELVEFIRALPKESLGLKEGAPVEDRKQ